jgi:hypothetical protein
VEEAILEKNATVKHFAERTQREGKEGMTDGIEAVPRVPLDVVLPPELLRRSFENLGFGDLCSIANSDGVP